MLTIQNQPLLDKSRLIGGCIRLQLRADAARLRSEVAALPERFWGNRGGRVGVHNPAQAVFIRGHAPAEGDLPIIAREASAYLPYIGELIHRDIPAEPMRCLLALLPGGAVIAPHVDMGAPYFGQTVRIHVPIITNPLVWMFCNGASYHMNEGEIWALNNSSMHAVWNADPKHARIHLICDFLPSKPLLALLDSGDRNLGKDEPRIREHLLGSHSTSPDT